MTDKREREGERDGQRGGRREEIKRERETDRRMKDVGLFLTFPLFHMLASFE